MEFRQIQYFICLYEEGSVTRASRRLHIVQSALSQQLAKLEEKVGQPLFVRAARGMTPTAAGQRMYKLFLPVVTEFDRAREQMLDTGAELTGHVRIGMIGSVAQAILQEAVTEFAQAHPRVMLSLTDGFSEPLCEAVAAGRLDAAVINKPRQRLALHTEWVLQEDVVLLRGGCHPPLAAELPCRELADLKLVLPTRQHGLRTILDSFALAEDIDLCPALEVDSTHAVVRLLQTGGFVALLPPIAVRDQLRRGELHAHRVVAPALLRRLACISHPRRPLDAAATAFVATLKRHVHDAAAWPGPAGDVAVISGSEGSHQN